MIVIFLVWADFNVYIRFFFNFRRPFLALSIFSQKKDLKTTDPFSDRCIPSGLKSSVLRLADGPKKGLYDGMKYTFADGLLNSCRILL